MFHFWNENSNRSNLERKFKPFHFGTKNNDSPQGRKVSITMKKTNTTTTTKITANDVHVLTKAEEKQVLLQNNIKDFMQSVDVSETGLTINGTALTEKDFQFDDGFKDLSQWKNLNNPVLERQFKQIQKYRAQIRLACVNIGGVMFDIRNSGSYKKSLKDFGIKSKDFTVFSKEVFGLSKTQTYRYLGVYAMCADIKGNVDKRVALLAPSQLYALFEAKVTHDEIIALLDTIDGIEDAKELSTAIKDGVKALEDKHTKEKTEAEAEAEAESPKNNELPEMYKPISNARMYKGTLKGQKPIFIPNTENAIPYVKTHCELFPNTDRENMIIGYGTDESAEFITISDAKHKNVLVYVHVLSKDELDKVTDGELDGELDGIEE